VSNKHYILSGHEVIEVPLDRWAKWFETADRRVAKDVVDDIEISTVFLGLDHGWNGELLLFETMVFGKDREEQGCYRYKTWDEAYIGHKITMIGILGGRRYGIRRSTNNITRP